MDGVEPRSEASGLSGRIGDRIGPYRIEAVLGKGGFATVYAARLVDDEGARPDGLRSDVALKILERREDIGRFRREGLAAKEMRHPHLVRGFGMFEHSGMPVLIMEHVPGQNLRDYVRATRPSLGQAMEIARRIGLALQHMHQRGWVHRDVKPSNVLGLPNRPAGGRGSTGRADWTRVRLGDFGLAKPMDDGHERDITAENVVIGTFAYMPPEQMAAFEQVRQTGDVFALAGCLYFMITGEPPFGGQRANAATDDFPDLCDVVGVPPEVAAVVQRATLRPPADRYPTIDEFLHDLAHCQASDEATEKHQAPQPQPRTTTMATDQLKRAIVRIHDVFANAQGDAGAQVVPLAPATYAVRLQTGARFELARVPELRFPLLERGWLALAGVELSLCVRAFQTRVAEADGRAVQAVTRSLEVASWVPTANEQVYFSRARGEPTHFCTVRSIEEWTGADVNYVGFRGVELRFRRQATREDVCTLLVVASA